jgi:hypothetical protein
MPKTWFIVVEKKGVIGNPILIEDPRNEIVTDSNHNLLITIGFFQDIKLAKNSARENSDRSIYAWKVGERQAWYRRKY